MHDTQTLSGPDFLEEVAEAELHQGNTVNSATFLQRARDWRSEQRALEEAHTTIDALERRLAAVRTSLEQAA